MAEEERADADVEDAESEESSEQADIPSTAAVSIDATSTVRCFVRIIVIHIFRDGPRTEPYVD
ncbi:hypothetical protein AB0H71_16675 [Nocardia sp. NPDC050697]|uniref:hypothetical protein n=1 Tax=Nocardia sp. NPDC050697 TaxID=3155158 RepID=UPI0033F8F257